MGKIWTFPLSFDAGGRGIESVRDWEEPVEFHEEKWKSVTNLCLGSSVLFKFLDDKI